MKNYALAIGFLLGFLQSAAQVKTTVSLYNVEENPDLKARIEQTASSFITECNLAYALNIEPHFSADSVTSQVQSNVNEIWSKSKGFLCRKVRIRTLAIKREYDNKYEIRGIPIIIREGYSQEEAILVYDQKGNVDDFLLGVPEQQYSVLSSGKNVTDFRRRQIILNFVETFRTSYNRKDINYLEKVFSDNALIIVGKVIKEKTGDVPNYLSSLGAKVVLLKKTKQEYMNDLKIVFKTNSYIRVDFDSISIVQHKKFEDIYGVNLIQKWSSSQYKDEGFLFLMIDFKNENEPTIYVRSWQPKEFTESKDVINLGKFKIE